MVNMPLLFLGVLKKLSSQLIISVVCLNTGKDQGGEFLWVGRTDFTSKSATNKRLLLC